MLIPTIFQQKRKLNSGSKKEQRMELEHYKAPPGVRSFHIPYIQPITMDDVVHPDVWWGKNEVSVCTLEKAPGERFTRHKCEHHNILVEFGIGED
jgi:hypothetical protein